MNKLIAAIGTASEVAAAVLMAGFCVGMLIAAFAA